MKQCGNMPCVLIYMYVQLFNSENLRSWGWMPFKIVSFSPSCSGCLFYLYFFSFFVLLGGKYSSWIFFFSVEASLFWKEGDSLVKVCLFIRRVIEEIVWFVGGISIFSWGLVGYFDDFWGLGAWYGYLEMLL